jgi:hypothetical protein
MTIQEKSTLQIGDKLFINVLPGSEWVEIEMGKEKMRVKISEIWAVTFALCGPEQQEKMMPVRQTEMMTYEKIYKVRATKDIRKGEVIKFRAKIDVPLTITESLRGGLIDEKRKTIWTPG